MISTDRNIFKEESDVRARMIEYGQLVGGLHIIVFSRRDVRYRVSNISNISNVFIYPTNSRSRWFYIIDAIRIGKKILTTNYKLQTMNWLVTSQDPFETGLVGWRLKRRFGLPLQLQIHTDVFSPYFKNQSFLNRLRVWAARFLIPRADCVRVVSRRIQESIARPSAVLPIFVDVEEIKQMPVSVDLHKKYPQYEKIILMASRLTKEKNIGLAVEAIGEIKNTLLLTVGDGPEKENLEAKSRKLKANVVFESAVPFKTLISYYKTADVYLLTSNYEGYGRTLVEAAAAGCPIVSTDVGVAREIKGAKVVPVGDRSGLTRALAGENLKSAPPETGSYDEYLAAMKRAWEQCL